MEARESKTQDSSDSDGKGGCGARGQVPKRVGLVFRSPETIDTTL